ncbi:MAG: pilin [Patescibacteria group bacterium]
MKRAIYTLASAALFAPVFLVSAQGITDPGGGAGDFERLLKNILDFINDVLIPFIIGIGFLVFVWGMFKYFIAGGSDEEKQKEGKSLMIYATLGFVLIVIFWGVVNLLASSTGLEDDRQLDDIPQVPTI